MMADCGIVVATIFMLLWMSAVPALVLRRYLDLDGTEVDVFA
jgi:predicted thioesterase